MIVILMGVTGAGKTTVGRGLAQELGWRFIDGDDYQPRANIDKMARGIPLTDADRVLWLPRLRRLIERYLRNGQSAVIACSALKQAYRDYLSVDAREVRFVYLKGEYELIRARLKGRQGHFAKEDLLASQFSTLEEPEGVLTVDVAQDPDTIIAVIRQSLGLDAANGQGT